MIHKTSARRLAALASGALVAGGLVVAPAVAGLAAATAAPVSIDYTCSGPNPLGGTVTLPGTLTIDLTTPATVLPGTDFPATIDAKMDLGTLPAGLPITTLDGSFGIPLTVGSDTATFTTPVQTAPASALVYTGAGAVNGLTSPATLGDAPITVGTIAGNFSALGGVATIAATCTPDEGESTTVGSVTVAEDAPVTEHVPVTGTVKVTGTPKVGKTLKAVPGSSDGATVTYQWLANGKPISKATKSSLKLSKSLKGKKVSVQATYGKDSYLPTTQTSKSVKVK